MPSPISNQPPIDTINLSLLPSRNTTLLSFTPALPTLDIFGEQLILFFIANLPLHSLPPFHPPPSQSSLQILHPASETEVLLLLNSLPNKQCELDPIPTSLLKDCASVLLP